MTTIVRITGVCGTLIQKSNEDKYPQIVGVLSGLGNIGILYTHVPFEVSFCANEDSFQS